MYAAEQGLGPVAPYPGQTVRMITAPDSSGRPGAARPTSVPIADDSIRLGQFLKLADLAETGAAAREMLEDGMVSVNGADETRRGRQLHRGDQVVVDLPTGPVSAVVG